MSPRAIFVFGRRLGDGQNGAFVAPPGVDAHYDSIDQMMLAATKSIPQLVGNSSAVNGQTVIHGLGYVPLVILTSISSLGRTGVGNVRPFGNMSSGLGRFASVSVNTNLFQVSTPFGTAGYHLYRQPL